MSDITPAQQEARTFVETLQNDAPNAQALLEQQKDKPEILDAIKEELSKLDAKQHELVTANLRNLEMQISATEQNEATARLKAHVEEMQKSMEKPNVLSEQKPDAVAAEVAATDTEEKTATKPPEGFMETMKSYAVQAKDWTKEQLDVSKWSPTKKATVATLTIGAVALLAYLAFRKKKGNENEQKNETGGFPKWLLWVPILGLVGWGGYKLYNKIGGIEQGFKKVKEGIDGATDVLDEYIPGAGTTIDTGLSVGEGVTGGINKGLSKTVENFAESFASKEGEQSSISKVVADKGKYESNESYAGALLWAGVKDGWNYGVCGGALYLCKQGKEIVCSIPEIVGIAWNGLTDPRGSFEGEGVDVIKVYIGSSVVYATSFGIIDFLNLRGALGTKEALKAVGWRSAGWPYEIYRKSGVKYAMGYIRPDAQGILTRTEAATFIKKPAFIWNRGRQMFKGWSEEYLEILYKEWRGWNSMLTKIEQIDTAGETSKILAYRRNVVGNAIRKGLAEVYKKKGTVPKFIEELNDRSFMRQIKRNQIDLGNLTRVLEKGSIAEDATELEMPKVNAALKEIPLGVADEKPVLRKAAGAESMSEAVPNPATAKPIDKPELKIYDPDDMIGTETAKAASESTDAAKAGTQTEKLLGDTKFGERIARAGTSAEDVKALLELAEEAGEKIDADLLIKIQGSRKAQKLLIGAAKSGDVAEMSRVLRAANRARNVRIGFNAFGAALDAFGIVMTYCDWQENKERIEDTKNPALKELYGNANYIYAGEAGTSAVGLTISGVAAFTAWKGGASVLTALGASGGLIMLPIGVAALTTREMHKRLEASAEYHLQSRADLMGKTDGAILQHVGKTSADESLNSMQDVFLPAFTKNEANESARSDGYDAYFRKTAELSVPMAAAASDLEDRVIAEIEEMANGDEKAFGELIAEQVKVENKERVSFFVNRATDFISYKTNKTFESVDAETLERARLYAQMEFGKKYVNGMETTRQHEDWLKVEQDVIGYQSDMRKDLINYLVTSKETDEFVAEAPMLLLEAMRSHLAVCEQRILEANYPNWTSGASWSKWYGEADFQIAARGWYAREIVNTINVIKQKRTALTEQDISTALRSMEKIVQENAPASIVSDFGGEIDALYAYGEKIGMNLSVENIARQIMTEAGSAPESPEKKAA